VDKKVQFLFLLTAIYKMYGVSILYYIYLFILVITLILTFAVVGISVVSGSVRAILGALLLMLPGLLFTGWLAFVLGKCRKSIEAAVKPY